MKIKDFYLSALNENEEDFFYLDKDSVKEVLDVITNREENYIKISFDTTYGKKVDLVCDYDKFVSWYKKNKNTNPQEVFKNFLIDFISTSKEVDSSVENVNEIVDDNGDIMPSTDLPSNSTNTMVGTTLKWDLDKVYKSIKPRSMKYFNSGYGLSLITW